MRLGAIYALEKIAHDSADYHWQVMEVLTAYVRDRYPWKEDAEPKRGDEVPLDLEAVMTVLRRRKHERETKEQTINLAGTDLRKVNLIKVKLQGAQFIGANLQGVNLEKGDLQNAWFNGANQQGVNYENAHLQGARFAVTNLQYAWFGEANLQGAIFLGANLQETAFHEAHLQGTKFFDSKLQRAFALTQEQIDLAICDEKTILPEGLNNVKALENRKKYREGKK